MARPIAMRADVSQSRPGRRVIPANRHGPVTDQPDWVSLDAIVEVELDDGRSVSPPERPTCAGAPLDCSRRELEEGIRSLIFSEPRYLPNDPRAEPASTRHRAAGTWRRHHPGGAGRPPTHDHRERRRRRAPGKARPNQSQSSLRVAAAAWRDIRERVRRELTVEWPLGPGSRVEPARRGWRGVKPSPPRRQPQLRSSRTSTRRPSSRGT